MDSVSTHPQYSEMLSTWQQLRDTSAGERAVKDATTTYLPKTAGQLADKQYGQSSYDAYLLRSVWYDYLRNTQRDSIGLLHRERAIISLPNGLDGYVTKATDDGDSANMLLRRINEQQLITGRGGLLLDFIEGVDHPVTTIHMAEKILNWDSSGPVPRWIILDESGYVVGLEDMKWEWKNTYKLLALDSNDRYFTRTFIKWEGSLLADPVEGDEAIYPVYRGRPFNKIPFTFFNASNLLPDIELPPLLPLSNACLTIYKGSADYRQALHMQGFAVLFLKGFEENELGNIRVGSGTYISTRGDGADAKFLEVSGAGLGEMRSSQNDMKDYAENLGIELKDQSSPESGKALSTRLTIRTAALETIAITAASAVLSQIAYAIEWMGITGDYSVEPNLDFIEQNETADELLKMKQAYDTGAVTTFDFWSWMRSKDYTRMQFEEWKRAMEDEAKNPGNMEEKIQKIYLGVGKVITKDEARAILNGDNTPLSIPGPDVTLDR